MSAIKIAAFSGEQPRVIPRLLPDNGATSALDARLDDGSLLPYRRPAFVANLDPTFILGNNLRTLGTPLGDLTGGGDLEAAFDDTTAQAAAACASKGSSPTTGYVGLDFGVAPKRIYKAIVFGSNDAGFISDANPEITITLYGSEEEPDDETDGTVLGSSTFNDTADESSGREIESDNKGTPWRHVWATIATASGTAINVAELQPFESVEVPFATLYNHGEDWLAWTGVVNAAPGPVAADRLYYTGDGVPKMRVDDTIYPLAVPAPSTAPTATEDTGGSGDPQSRAYVYTFVTDFGEESEPSPVSNTIEWLPGEDPVLSGIEDAPAGRNITKQRFYRTQSGSVGTDFYFIAERDASDDPFTDDVAPNAFAEPLPSRYWNAPPDDLAGLTAMPNGMMAAFRGKQLYFCEPFRPHAWPEIYVLTVDFPIVALAAAGTTLWVLTQGYPYRVVGTTPGSMVSEKVEANLPCVSARGVVDLGHAIAWPSTDGLAAARGAGVGLVTENIFAPRDWLRLNPGTMRSGQINGRWIGAYDGLNAQGVAISGSLILDIASQSFLIRSALQSRAWYFDLATGFLYFIPPDAPEVQQFDPEGGDRTNYYWRSKSFVLARPESMGCILIESGAGVTQSEIDARIAEIEEIIEANEDMLESGSVGGELAGEAIGVTTLGGDLLFPIPPAAGTTVSVCVYAAEELLASVETLGTPVRLPGGHTARIWHVDVFGDITIDQITLARTMDELKVAAGGP